MAFIPAIPLILEGAEIIIAAVEAAEVIEGGVLASEAVVATAEGGAIAAAGETAVAGGMAAAEGAGVAGGGAVAAEGGGAVVVAGGAQAGGAAAQLSLLETAVQASQWVARQIVEFEAFDLGMQALEKAIAKLREITKSPEAKEMDEIVQKFNKAITLLDAALKQWSNWMAANFDKKASFGNIQTPAISLLRFDIFRNRLGTLVDIRKNQVSSAGITASKTPTVDNFRALLRAAQSYCTEMGQLSQELMQPGTPLADGGLNSFKDDIQTAQNTLA